MPYPPDHKAKTRARIVGSARALFNRRGFDQVTIDEVMTHAGLTRGGFYHHFSSKEDLYAEAVASIAGCSPFSRHVAGRGACDRDELAHLLVDMYLADETLADVDTQCPLYALPSDVARSGRSTRVEYTKIVERLASVLRGSRPLREEADDGFAALALCVGAMVLARTTHDAALARTVRVAARGAAHALLASGGEGRAQRRSPSGRRRPKSSRARGASARPKSS